MKYIGDFKELKKFGFEECRDYYYYDKAFLEDEVMVNKRSKTISKFGFIEKLSGRKRDRRKDTIKKIPIVKELIQAGLIEEVEE